MYWHRFNSFFLDDNNENDPPEDNLNHIPPKPPNDGPFGFWDRDMRTKHSHRRKHPPPPFGIGFIFPPKTWGKTELLEDFQDKEDAIEFLKIQKFQLKLIKRKMASQIERLENINKEIEDLINKTVSNPDYNSEDFLKTLKNRSQDFSKHK